MMLALPDHIVRQGDVTRKSSASAAIAQRIIMVYGYLCAIEPLAPRQERLLALSDKVFGGSIVGHKCGDV
jgi:hypothetical protein